jgi:hypothetical protein
MKIKNNQILSTLGINSLIIIILVFLDFASGEVLIGMNHPY